MPHVDVETLVSSCVGGSDRKVNCETLAKEDLAADDVDSAVVVEIPPDFPPESFCLSKDAELDWFDRNAFFERKESGKGISNSTNMNVNQSSNSNSSHNLKSSLFGLPNTQKTNHLDSKRRFNKPSHLFPKRSESITGKSSVTVVEPSSPKVSCIGRVRSKRSRRKSGKNREKSAEKSRRGGGERKKGFYSRMMSIFKVNTNCGEIKTGRPLPDDEFVNEESTAEQATKKSTGLRIGESLTVGTERKPPMVGGMKKFASGRRFGSETTDAFAVVGTI